MKLNNKGFAITTILYGLLILFLLLFLSLLGILSQYKNNLEKLVENANGARGIVTLRPLPNMPTEITERGLYCENENKCCYLSIGDEPHCNQK